MLFNKEVTEETETGSYRRAGTPFPPLPPVQIIKEPKAGTSCQNQSWYIFRFFR